MSKENFEKLESMIVKLDERIDDRLNSMDKTLVRNTLSLEQHIKRTDVLETYVKDQIVKEDLEPIKKHVSKVSNGINGILWFCSAVAGVAGFLYILKQLNVV